MRITKRADGSEQREYDNVLLLLLLTWEVQNKSTGSWLAVQREYNDVLLLAWDVQNESMRPLLLTYHVGDTDKGRRAWTVDTNNLKNVVLTEVGW